MSSKSNTETLATVIRRRIRLCGYCDYYPASEYGGRCCTCCVRDHLEFEERLEEERKAKEAKDLIVQEAARLRAEQLKREFDQMVINSAVKPGKSFADVLKNKK